MTDFPLARAELLDERVEFELDEVCSLCRVRRQVIIELVEEGVAEPAGQAPSDWRFSGRTVTRLQAALRLHRDLDINLPGVALALDLLEEIERLRQAVANP